MCNFVEDTYTFTQENAPEEFLEQMHDKRTEDGAVFFPAGFDDGTYRGDSFSYRCRLNWDVEDVKNVQSEFNLLYNTIREIALSAEKLDGTQENAKQILTSEQFSVWEAYLKDFGTEGFDTEKIQEIRERLTISKIVKDLTKRYSQGKKLGENEKDYLREYLDISVTPEEMKLYNEYSAFIANECEKRAGKGIAAYMLINRARRLYQLIVLKAPEKIVNFEACMLAAMLAVHRYGVSIDKVDDATRIYFEQFDTDDDDVLDELYKIKKTNKRKTLLPLFVFFIIMNHSDSEHHLRYNDIIAYLESEYGVTIERKAVSRTVHALADSQLSIYADPKLGVWVEK